MGKLFKGTRRDLKKISGIFFLNGWNFRKIGEILKNVGKYKNYARHWEKKWILLFKDMEECFEDTISMQHCVESLNKE